MCSCTIIYTKFGLTYEKELNSSWFMFAITFLSVGVSLGSSLVKSVSKLPTSVLDFCNPKTPGFIRNQACTIIINFVTCNNNYIAYLQLPLFFSNNWSHYFDSLTYSIYKVVKSFL